MTVAQLGRHERASVCCAGNGRALVWRLPSFPAGELVSGKLVLRKLVLSRLVSGELVSETSQRAKGATCELAS